MLIEPTSDGSLFDCEWKWATWTAEYHLATSGGTSGAPGMRPLHVHSSRKITARERVETVGTTGSLIRAIEARDQVFLDRTLAAGADPNADLQFFGGKLPLRLAMEQKPPNLSAIGSLLRAKADPSIRVDGVNALHWAIRHGGDYGNGSGGECNHPLLGALVVQALLAGGTDPTLTSPAWKASTNILPNESNTISSISAAMDRKHELLNCNGDPANEPLRPPDHSSMKPCAKWCMVAALVAAGAEPTPAERSRVGPCFWEMLESPRGTKVVHERKRMGIDKDEWNSYLSVTDNEGFFLDVSDPLREDQFPAGIVWRPPC